VAVASKVANQGENKKADNTIPIGMLETTFGAQHT